MLSFIVYLIFFFWILIFFFFLKWSKGRILNSTLMLLMIAHIDVFFPAVYAAFSGFLKVPIWVEDLGLNNIISGISFYSFFLFIFFLFISIGKSSIRNLNTNTIHFTKSFDRKILIHLTFLLFFSVFKIILEIIQVGGINQFLLNKAVLSANSTTSSIDNGYNFLLKIPIESLFQALVGLGFYFRRLSKYKFLFTWFFPFFLILLSLLTLLRGSLIYALFVLIFAEILRLNPTGFRLRFSSFFNVRLRAILLIILVFSLTAVFGFFRDIYRIERTGEINASKEFNSIVPNFMTQGAGLIGVSSVVKSYGNKVDFLYGKTYFDMFLLPIPRFIYTSKPNWYGIDDISRGLSWPESTQSAITMPGEAYANFGFLGILVAIPLGLFFGIFEKLINKNPFLYLIIGPLFYLQMLTVTNWMAFTGLVNSLMLIVFIYLYFNIFFRYKVKI